MREKIETGISAMSCDGNRLVAAVSRNQELASTKGIGGPRRLSYA